MTKKSTREEFIEKARKVHGEKYDYSKVEYVDCKTPITIICPIHGDFTQTPSDHLSNHGCGWCGRSKKLTTEKFIERAKKIHGDKYDYTKSIYKGNDEPICITCPIHGDFTQTPHDHLGGHGCRYCGKEVARKKHITPFKKVLAKCKKVHKMLYEYDETSYIDTHHDFRIFCKKHGWFTQTPNNHISQKQGCPICNQSHLEKEVKMFLIEQKIEFEEQKRFKWLGKMSLDFYLPQYNVAIECQGRQHFIENEYFGELEEILKRDKRKKELSEEHNVKLLYYSNLKIDYPYLVYTDFNSLIENIKKE